MERYRRTGPEVNLAASYHGLAGYYLQFEQYALAIENYLKSGEYFTGPRSRRASAANRTLMAGWSYRVWGNLDRAEPYIRQALKDNEEQHYFAGMSECYMELGRLELLRGDTLKALQCFKDTRVSWARVPILQQGVCRVLLAMSYIWTGQLDSARMELDTVNVMAARTISPSLPSVATEKSPATISISAPLGTALPLPVTWKRPWAKPRRCIAWAWS
ncbi:MAG: tetratricopeptide repeat protein [Flavobacteriales bacterium]|nr:tetratricopeptide repeat protein [Flavobacteriales bacterium]